MSEKNKAFAAMHDFKGKFNHRQLIMVFVLSFTILAEIFVDFVSAGFDPSIFTEASYWIQLVIKILSVVLITLTVRDFFREKELSNNLKIKDTQSELDKAHSDLMRHDLTTRFADYVGSLNSKSKLAAYRAYLQYKLSKAKKEKKSKRWQTLLDKCEQDILFLPTKGDKVYLSFWRRIKFNQVKVSTIFSRTGRKYTSDEDLETGESAHVGRLLTQKVTLLIAFSVTFSSLIFSPCTFTLAIFISVFFRLARTAFSIWMGAGDGIEFVRGTLLNKMRLRLDFVQKFLESEKAAKKVVAEAIKEAEAAA